MQVEVTTRIVTTDAVGRHIATVEVTERKDVGDNPQFYVPGTLQVAEALADHVTFASARAVDRERAAVR